MEDVIPDVATDPLNNAASNVPRFLSPGRSLISAWNFAVAPVRCREIVILLDSVLGVETAGFLRSDSGQQSSAHFYRGASTMDVWRVLENDQFVISRGNLDDEWNWKFVFLFITTYLSYRPISTTTFDTRFFHTLCVGSIDDTMRKISSLTHTRRESEYQHIGILSAA